MRGRQLLQHRQLLAPQAVAALHLAPGIQWLHHIAGGVCQGVELLAQPLHPPLLRQPVPQADVELPEIDDIIQGIAQLGLLQRPPLPVGATVALGQLHLQLLVHQLAITHLFAMAQQRCGGLGIEQGRGQLAAQLLEDLQVLARGMKHLHRAGAIEQIQQWRPALQLQHIHRCRHLAIAYLHQAELGIIGLLANELGVQREPITGFELLTEFVELLGGLDVLLLHVRVPGVGHWSSVRGG